MTMRALILAPLALVAALLFVPAVLADCPQHVYHCRGPIALPGNMTANATVEVGGTSEGSYVNVTTNNTAASAGNVSVNVSVPSTYSADSATVGVGLTAQGIELGKASGSETIAKGSSARFVFPFTIVSWASDIPIALAFTTPDGPAQTTLMIHVLPETKTPPWWLAMPGPGAALVVLALAAVALLARRR